MKIPSPPNTHPLAEEDGLPTLQWILFFNALYEGDTGTEWEPAFTSLGASGAPTITGRYYKIGRLVYFSVRIVPATNTTSTAGTTYINNFPLSITQDGACLAVTGLLGSNAGMAEASTNRIYTPAWSTVTVPVTIVGLVEAT